VNSEQIEYIKGNEKYFKKKRRVAPSLAEVEENRKNLQRYDKRSQNA
jgi:hypothetical protein